MELSSTAVFVMMLLALILGIFSGYYVFIVLGGLGVLFGLAFWGVEVFNLVFTSTLGTMRNYSLLAIPLFVFMGHMLDRSGIAKKLFDILAISLGGLRGGMAVAALFISILFAACTGIIGASVVTMGLLFLPAMLERGYNKSMASGVVCAGGTLGILIPPSIMLIVYGPAAGLSVGRLFYAALGPGLLMGTFYVIYVLVRCYVNPEMGPAVPLEERKAIPTWEKVKGLLVNMVPVLALILAVLGVIWFGIAPPTEAAAVGALVSMIIAAAHKKLNFQVLKETVHSTLLTSSMIMMIVVTANVFVGVFTRLGGGRVVQELLLGLPFDKWGVFVCMMAIVFLLGLLMDWVASLLIIVPLFTPIAATLGFDPLWFAVMVCVMYQTSFLTPPFAYSIFYLRGIAPPEVKTPDIMRGVTPFVLIQVITLLMCIAFPQVVMWLPEQLIR